MVHEFESIKDTWPRYFSIGAAQFLGSLTAILLNYQCAWITYPNDFQKVIKPAVPVLCPASSGYSCEKDTDSQIVVKYEFMCTVLFVFTWLIIKNAPVEGQMANLIKPFAIYLVYYQCRIFNAFISGGPLNPTSSFSLWIWNLGAYNDPISQEQGAISVYTSLFLGRFVWVYIGCPLFAGTIAGGGYRAWENHFMES